MAINYPIIYEIAYQTYDINEFGMASFFVLVGENRGLVIDCGCGSFDARGLVEKLCPLPYDVVITHAHGDHCGAMSQWDKVWLHPREYDFAHNTEHLVDMLHQNPALWRGAMERGIHIPMADGSEWNYPSSNMGAKEFYELDDLKECLNFFPLQMDRFLILAAVGSSKPSMFRDTEPDTALLLIPVSESCFPVTAATIT